MPLKKAKEAVTQWNGRRLKYIIRFRSVLLHDKEELCVLRHETGEIKRAERGLYLVNILTCNSITRKDNRARFVIITGVRFSL